MDRATATVLIDPLCGQLPAGGTDAVSDVDCGGFRERVGWVAEQYRAENNSDVWQYAICPTREEIVLRRPSLITGCLAAATLLAIVCVIGISLDADSYYVDEARPAAWVYRPGIVALVCAVMLAEVALVWAAFVSVWPRALWVRCGLAMIFLGPWALLVSQFVVRMPVYVVFHHLWLWALAALLVLAALASMVRGVYSRLTR